MSKFEHSFNKVYEAFWNRATAGGFNAGDVVKFDMKNIQKHPDYETLTELIKTRLDNMMRTSESGESVIVVTDVILGCCSPKAYEPSSLTIAYSHGGGRWVEPLTIPGSLGEFMKAEESVVNLVDKIPSVVKIEHPVSTKAEEIDLKELENMRTKGHASSTLHGESVEIDKYGTRTHKFDVGEKYQADWAKKIVFEVIKRNDTHVTLKPLTLDPDSLEGMIHNKPIRRKIERTYMPQVKEYCENAKISAHAGYIYADSPYIVYGKK